LDIPEQYRKYLRPLEPYVLPYNGWEDKIEDPNFFMPADKRIPYVKPQEPYPAENMDNEKNMGWEFMTNNWF
jgi:hypothetical protein